jgi:hypothetical protein
MLGCVVAWWQVVAVAGRRGAAAASSRGVFAGSDVCDRPRGDAECSCTKQACMGWWSQQLAAQQDCQLPRKLNALNASAAIACSAWLQWCRSCSSASCKAAVWLCKTPCGNDCQSDQHCVWLIASHRVLDPGCRQWSACSCTGMGAVLFFYFICFFLVPHPSGAAVFKPALATDQSAG